MVRDRLPWWLWRQLGWPDRSHKDCGAHEWFNHDDVEDHCYHCYAGRRPHRGSLAVRPNEVVGHDAG